MDFYDHVVSSENLGTCAAASAGTVLDLPDSGRVTGLTQGVGNFSQFTVVGGPHPSAGLPAPHPAHCD